MPSRSNRRLELRFAFLTGTGLCVALLWGLSSSQPARTESLTINYPIDIAPDQMALAGDVTTGANCVHPEVCAWLDGTPPGSMMLGVDPASPDPGNWDGGSASAEIFLPDIYNPTLVVLKLSWPDRDLKWPHLPGPHRFGAVTFDGLRLWDKRTTELSPFDDDYAAESEPILTTIVLTQSITHTLGLSISAGAAWNLSQVELTAYPYPATIKGIGYSPFRDCQYPGGERLPSVQDLREDLFRLFHTTNSIRTYAASGINGEIPQLANEISLPVYAGAWIDYPTTTMAQDNAEVQALVDLACTSDIKAAIVGNEYYLRHRSPESINYLLQRISEVSDGILNACGKDVPVTTAEIDNLMFGWVGDPPDIITGIQSTYLPIVEAVDFLVVHTYPFWNEMPVDGGAAFTVNRYNAMQALMEQQYPGEDKWILLGEAGWPSGGGSNNLAIPTLRNQRKYILEFLSLAEQEGVEFMYFDAFDELWKIEEPGQVGQRWGYSYADRSAKHRFYGVLLPPALFPPLPQPLIHTGYLPYLTRGQPDIRRFPVYSEWPEGPGRFVPSGWMGDIGNIEFYGCDRSEPHGGEMAIRASFAPAGALGWGGIHWQYPENNWGNIDDGIDLSWANKLTFWAKGKDGEEKIRFFAGGIGTKGDPYPDSLRPEASTGFIQLTDRWQKYTLNLLPGRPTPSYGQDLSHVIGGFGWATDQCANPTGATFYLDDIFFEYDPNLTPPSPPGPTFAVYTDAGAPGTHYFPTGWMGDAAAPSRVALTECWTDNPQSGGTSIRIAYTQEVVGWAGTYWLHPAGNWGDRPGGYDLTGADRLTFWARSETPNAWVKFLVGGIGYPVDSQGRADCAHPMEPYPDSVCPKIEPWAQLSPTWTKYTVDLHQVPGDLSKVVGGFGWVAEDPVIFYLDEIFYEFD